MGRFRVWFTQYKDVDKNGKKDEKNPNHPKKFQKMPENEKKTILMK